MNTHRRSLEERFWAKFHVTENGCWVWQGARSSPRPGYGYGQIGSGGGRKVGRTLKAHRVAYELLVGPIPKGLDLDHLCRDRLCVNPDHLEPVTRKENLRRGQGPTGVHYRQTACHRGHPFDSTNTYVTGRGFRQCKACREIRRARYRAQIDAVRSARRAAE